MNNPVVQKIIEYPFKEMYKLYPDAIKSKAHSKKKSEDCENLLKLDKWFQEDLIKTISSRKTPHITREELVDIMKWKLLRGKWRPRLIQLAESNSSESVIDVSSKAFSLANKGQVLKAVEKSTELKGVGPATASAILAVGSSTNCSFFADEVAEVFLQEKATYTLKEYLQINDSILEVRNHLNKENEEWTAHNVELTIWTYVILSNTNSSLLRRDEDRPELQAPKKLRK
ncbi:hypothetical protein Anas_02075 [Armadillidium nasatum]|uniref:Uncharacterized protein n=1 Tax=Armadillidium nasatum TaxID=96803 RepID=A0A5N5SZY4_9CRUS|nr:hypothetical protein Anas_02075 [Armadillidium nasatum]